MSTGNATNPYEAVLADLRAQREQIDVAIAAISRLSGIKVPDAPVSNTLATPGALRQTDSGIRSDTFFNMTVQDAVKKCLRISKRPLETTAIRDLLEKGGIIHDSKNFYNSVYTALTRLRRAHELVQLDNKEWGLAEWYPNRPRQAKRNNSSETDAESDGNETSSDEEGGSTQEEIALKAV